MIVPAHKRAVAEISDGFVWEDPRAGHVLALGDASDLSFVRGLTGGENADLVLADPPYAIANKGRVTLRGRKDQFFDEAWDYVTEEGMRALLSRLTELGAALAAPGNIWIWTSDWWLSDAKRAIRDAGFRAWPSYVWVKSNPPWQVRKANFASACEYLAMGSVRGNYFDLDALPKQRNWFVAAPEGEFTPAVCPWWVERPVVHASERLRKRSKGSERAEFLNRAQKPMDLIQAFVRAGCAEGALTLDLFGGTGSTLLAADRTGRRCVYVERDPEQLRAAGRRLAADRAAREEEEA